MLFSQQEVRRRPSPAARRYRPGRRFRPRVEQLEDRLVLATVNWIGGSGDWNGGTNWSNGTGPAAGDDAVIDVAGVVVTHSSGLHTVKSLTIDDSFTLSGGTLAIDGDLSVRNGNSFGLGNGTLARAKLSAGTTITQTGDGTLDGVTIASGSTIQVANGNSSTLSVKNGLTVNGTVLIGDTVGNAYFGSLSLANTQTIAGSGSIIFGNDVSNRISAPGSGTTVTLGPDLTVRGKNGSIRGSNTITHYVLLGTVVCDVADGRIEVGQFATDVVNSGRLEASTGGSLTISPGNWSNSGATSISGGGTLTIAAGSWTNTGTLTMDNSTINLGGAFDKTKLGNFTRSGGTVNLTGTYVGDGTPLVLDASTGIWNLGNGGTLQNITLVTAPGFSLMQTGAGTLDNVTIPGGSIVQVTNGTSSVLSVKNGLTLDGTVLIGDTVGNAYFGAMFLTTTQTISGSGSIIFGNNVNNNISASTNGVTITLGPDLKVRGKNGGIRGSFTSGDFTHYILQGTIESDVAGGSLDVGHFATDVVNTGPLKASNGGSLIVRPETWSNSGATSISGGGTLTIAAGTWTNTGTMTMDSSTINLGGSFDKTKLGNFTRSGGTVNLTGTCIGDGAPLVLDTSTGIWNLGNGGTLQNITLVTCPAFL